MKRVLIGLALIAVLSVPATAALTTITSPVGTVNPGWNLMTIPGIPIDPAVASVLPPIPLDGNLYRWDAATQGLKMYDSWNPEDYGAMLLTDGFWLVTDSAQTISYAGLDDNNTMDVWISLPKAGWAMIGNPFNRDYTWADAKVVDGNVTISLLQAAKTEGWLESYGYWWDSSTQSLCDFGIPEDFMSTDILLPWHGYWVQSYVDKIALILESS